MTDRNENNENNELNEQELEQTAGGFRLSGLFLDRDQYIQFHCPKCGATKKVATKMGLRVLAPICDNCRARMVEA